MSSNKQEIIEHQGRTGEGARPLSSAGGLVHLGRSGGGGREGSPGLVLPQRPKRGLGAGSVAMVEEQAAGRGRSRCACSRGGWRPPIALTAGKGPSGHPQAQMFRRPLLPPCPWLPPTRPDEHRRPLLHIFFHSSPVRQSPIR